MQWENDIWYTLRDGSISTDTAKQSKTRWVYDVIQTDQSTGSWRLWADFELVKFISHQCVITGRFNSTTEFVRLRLRSKGNIRTVGSALRGISWETSMTIAASRLQSWTTTDITSDLWQLHHRSNDDIAQVIILHPINSDSSDIIRTLDKILEAVNWMRAYKRSSTFIDILSSSS